MDCETVLFPPIEPFRTGMLRVDAMHTLYFEESGAPNGKPALFLHGGPGGGTWALDRRFWDPTHYRIVLFDQRGCGRSTPHGSLKCNTTADLVSDIEKLRRHLGIERWQILGGSWGATLALAYAQKHPERVSELILRSVFLGRRTEIEWLFQRGANQVFPDAWVSFRDHIAPEARGDLLGAYHRLLSGADDTRRLAAARAWCAWETAVATLKPSGAMSDWLADEATALTLARIECHYFAHAAFLKDDELLLQVGRLRDVPATIVHGRYDMICPLESAWTLHERWPETELRIVEAAGHSATEQTVAHELVKVIEGYCS